MWCKMASVAKSSPSACSERFHSIVALALWTLFLARVRGDAVGENRSNEVSALLNFRDSNGAGLNEGYWAAWEETDETPCGWFGVTCTTNYTVEELDFSGWGLDISTLEGLYNLADLRLLDLSSNSIRVEPLGGLGICNFTAKLTQLDLSSTGIISTGGPNGMPQSISACQNLHSSLRFLALEHNGLSALFPGIRDLVNLQFLSLANNLFTGPFPTEELGNLSSLVSLDLSYNSFTGNIPSLPKLTSLFDLILDNNNFTGFEEPWIIGAESLQQLSVSSNRLQGMIPSVITSLPNLKILKMARNNLSGRIPPGFSQLISYSDSTIDLSQNQLTGGIPTDMLSQANDSGVSSSVNLSRNLLTGNIPLDGSKPFNFLQLDLSYNNLSGPVPSDTFSHVNSTVWSFRLNDNHLSGDLVDIFFLGPGTMNAFEVRLDNNLFTGDLSRIVNTSLFVPAWRSIDLSNNSLRWSTSEAIPDPITALLERLLSSDTTQPSSVEFRAGGNDFSGTALPTACSVYNTTNFLTVLDLSNSHLHGKIFGAAFNSTCLPAIQLLNLSNNRVTGHVPQSIIADHRQDFILDVSNNSLSGPLPLIQPSSALYNPKYFAGNDGLCGDPLPSCARGIGRLPSWAQNIIIAGCVTGAVTIVAVITLVAACWRWRVNDKRHQQDDLDLLRILLERDSVRLIPLPELKAATKNFAESERIEEGGFGTVYRGRLTDGTAVAIKRSNQRDSAKNTEQLLNEVRILSQLNHDNLVKLLGCSIEKKSVLLVSEFISNGTLQQHLRGQIGAVRLTWKQRLNVAVQTANALSYLHSTRVYHRDVKSANILLDDRLNAKVADFGTSKLVPDQGTHVSTFGLQGTYGYVDPNAVATNRLTDKADVYSFGVVLLELISAKAALDHTRSGEANLVDFARPFIEGRVLEGLIDPALMATNSNGDDSESNPTAKIALDMRSRARPGGGNAQIGSILAVGKLALRCVDMSDPRARPRMQQVLEELQTLADLHGSTSELSESRSADRISRFDRSRSNHRECKSI